MNHVSTLTKDFNVTVDRLQAMANLTVKGVPDVVPQGSIQTLTTSVLVDMSVAATIRYEHRGDRQTDMFLIAPFYFSLSFPLLQFVFVSPCTVIAVKPCGALDFEPCS